MTAPGEEMEVSLGDEPDSANAPEEGFDPGVEAFYDVNKVPKELQESFKQMQGAWTKKNQTISEKYRWADNYGGPEQVQQVLDYLQTDEGMLEYSVRALQRMGVPQEAIQSLLAGEQDEDMDDTDEDDPGYATREDLAAFQQQLQMEKVNQYRQAQRSHDQAQIDQTLKELKVPAEVERLVIAAAYAHPKNLGYPERLRRGWKDFQQVAGGPTPGGPRGLKQGNTPFSAAKPPKTMEEAAEMARQFAAARAAE